MSDDLVAQLLEQASSDHNRGCEGRQYSCDCGYDIRTEGLLEQAAQALTEARAEIERLREWKQNQLVHWPMEIERRNRELAAAESELSTLRARVREVVGLGLDVISEERGWGTYPRMEGSEIYTDADVFSRAARQLMEDLK